MDPDPDPPLDPHSLCCLVSGSVLRMRIQIRIQEHGNWPKFTNKPGFLPFIKLCTFVGMFFDLLPSLNIYFSCKNLTFVTQKFDPDQPGSAFGLAP